MTFVAVLRRELRALVTLPQTYAIAAAYVVISGVFFVNLLVSSQVPDLKQYYSNVASTLIVLVPIVAMRSFAEERKNGTLDLTLSWPLSRTGLVFGKFAANTLFSWALISVVWIYVRILSGLASVDGARVAGGFIGMLLLAMAFSALALAVSARTSSPTAAAFIGFGLLLLLWILEYAPGWVRDAVRGLAPTAHFEAFPRGVLYLEDVAYFLVVTAIGVWLAIGSMTRNRPGPSLSSLVRRGLSLTVALVAVVGTPAMAERLDGDVDLTAAKRNTISPVTRDVVARIHDPISVTAFVRPISAEEAQLRNAVKMYRAAGARIDVRAVDPETQPSLARQAGITDYNKYIFELGGRREVLGDLGQVTVTSALNRLSRPDPPRACFTIGHGERSIDDSGPDGLNGLRGQLSEVGYDVRPLALAGIGGADELRRCTVVVVAGPRVAFLDGELAALTGYARDNGRLVVLADGVTGPREQLNALVGPYGMSFGPDIVRDLSSIADDPGSVVSFDYPSKSPVVVRLDDDNIPVVAPNPRPIGQAGDTDGYVSPLVRSSPKSWLQPAQGGPQKGPFLLAAVSDAARVEGTGRNSTLARTRIAAVGTADIAANRFFGFYGNRQFLTTLVQWVALENDLISAGRDPGGFYKLVLTGAQKSDLTRRGIVYPALAVLVPLPLTFFRLKRG